VNEINFDATPEEMKTASAIVRRARKLEGNQGLLATIVKNVKEQTP